MNRHQSKAAASKGATALLPTRDPSSHTAVGLSVSVIVREAVALLADHGTAGLTMSALAERLGVRAPSLYHHVRDKTALLELIAKEPFGNVTSDVSAYDDVASVDDWIAVTRSGTLRLRDYYAARPGLAALVQATATPNRDRGKGSRASLVRAQIQALVRIGVPRSNARATFETCARWTMAAVAAEIQPGLRPDDRAFNRGLDWLLHGLRADLEGVLSS